MSWERVAFREVVNDITGGNRKFLSIEYINSGIYPIIDQSEEYISGYTNQPEIAKRKKDVVLFGDHTKVLKYVDFDFCLGADGVKILEPADSLDAKYLYYYLKTINLPDVGYSRHFKFLKEIQIPLPPLPVQKRIAEILDAADALRRKDQELLNKYDELAQAIFIDMFGDPVKNEKGWEVKRLNEVCLNIYGGGTPSKSNPEFYVGNIPWVTPKDMKSDMINDSIDHINELAIEKSSTRIIPKNSVLMVIRSGILKHTLPVAINTEAVAINQDMKAFIPNYRYTNEYFLRYFLAGSADFLLGKVRAVTADNIEFQQIRSMEFICPPMKLQESFKHKIKILMNIRSNNSIFWGETLFQAVLYGAFRNGL